MECKCGSKMNVIYDKYELNIACLKCLNSLNNEEMGAYIENIVKQLTKKEAQIKEIEEGIEKIEKELNSGEIWVTRVLRARDKVKELLEKIVSNEV